MRGSLVKIDNKHALQGPSEAARSGLDGQTVTVEGIVTATFPGLGGFFVQDAGDGQATTSDALFVAFEEGVPAPAMASGDRVRVRGIVGERKAGGDDTLTALHAPVIQPRGTGRIAPTVLFMDAQGREVAERLEMPALWRLADDPSELVRRVVARRAPTGLLRALAEDDDLLVRWEVAQRARPDLLHLLSQDPAAEIRELAIQRLLDGDAPRTPDLDDSPDQQELCHG